MNRNHLIGACLFSLTASLTSCGLIGNGDSDASPDSVVVAQVDNEQDNPVIAKAVEVSQKLNENAILDDADYTVMMNYLDQYYDKLLSCIKDADSPEAIEQAQALCDKQFPLRDRFSLILGDASQVSSSVNERINRSDIGRKKQEVSKAIAAVMSSAAKSVQKPDSTAVAR